MSIISCCFMLLRSLKKLVLSRKVRKGIVMIREKKGREMKRIGERN